LKLSFDDKSSGDICSPLVINPLRAIDAKTPEFAFKFSKTDDGTPYVLFILRVRALG
jgi:hypothetical protein